jgi:hypothetical protein
MSRLTPAIALAVALAASLSVPTGAQESSSACSAHHAGVDERGDHVMGFDHTKTTHRFRLTASGGIIEVSAKSEDDDASRQAIRAHLAHISKMFAAGDFEAPMLIHDQVPPGVPVLKRDREKILWAYEDTPAGGRIIATTTSAAALEAIHEFLRFQIEDHRTGDATDIAPS